MADSTPTAMWIPSASRSSEKVEHASSLPRAGPWLLLIIRCLLFKPGSANQPQQRLGKIGFSWVAMYPDKSVKMCPPFYRRRDN